jgi:uncharacterized protein YggE
MKRILVAAIILPAALGAQQFRDSVISVSASRVAVVMADRASGWVVVEGTGETPADANARADTKLKAVGEAIRALGTAVSADRPISYGVAVAPNTNGYPMANVPTTYVARSVIRIQIAKLDQMGTAIASLLSAGAASVGNLAFESSASEGVRRDKVNEAIAAARSEAEALASALGGKLGALVDVSSSIPANFGFPQTQYLSIDSRFSSNQLLAPSVTVTTNVTLRFRLQR